MNKALMDNYVDIDEEGFKTIDQLLLSYNHRNNAVDYNVKKTIRCINATNLYGLELYLEIGNNCKDQAIRQQSLRRFVEYYLRPSMRNRNYGNIVS